MISILVATALILATFVLAESGVDPMVIPFGVITALIIGIIGVGIEDHIEDKKGNQQ